MRHEVENTERKEERKCKVCRRNQEILKHILMECKITGNGEEDWDKFLKGDVRSIGKLNEIVCKRKRNELKRQEGNVEAP